MTVRDDRGSSVATVVILTPIFVLMLFFVVYAGRLAVARQAAGAVARDAARSAAVGLDPPTDGHQALCAGGMHVSVSGADLGRGDQVTATATCAVDGGQLMASLGVGLTTVEAQATAWVDVYRSGS